MIQERIEGDLITRWSDDEKMILHKIGTEEYYTSATDLITSPYEYEEVEEVEKPEKLEE